MPTPFYQKIDQALSDSNLQAALDANAERRINARVTAFTSLTEDLSILRQRAHNVRLNTIEHLDYYLATFRKKALENGFIIHHATNGDEAIRIILEIARENQAQLIAKSKSMVSEEIELNKALENAGIKVVETDLGEYIVQIRGEAPAHIITPAVHLRRADVAKTFHELLGIPYTEDVADLTKAARQVLRQVFLDADIGISGVNFGVAESGLICVLTNEGNGRMVTTLPKVHIALMGIERLVPTMEDLSLMLSLLPRSATGQKITVYTSLIRAPRQSTEIDGSLERHIILIDNGRSAMRQSPLSEALLCIRCGACLNACPVFREIGGHAYVSRNGVHTPYPGPIGSVVSTPLFGYHEFGHLARASSLCGACREACPVDINLPDLLLRIRAGKVSNEKAEKPNPPEILKWGLKGFAFVASHAHLFNLAQKGMRLLTSMISPNSQWLRIPAWTGWGYGKDFPRPATQTFQDIWKKQSPQINHTASINPTTKTISHLDDPSEKLDNKNAHPTPPADLIHQFSRELTALGGVVHICQPEALASEIESYLDPELNILHLSQKAHQELRSLLGEVWLEKHARQYTKINPDLPSIMTTAVAACAETGSLLICSHPESPLTASLLPATHFVILHQDQIVPTLSDLLHHPRIQEASSSVLISGPSRTADIEMTLTIGVHGPAQLVVFLLVNNQ